MATRIRANGQLTVPHRVREALGLAPGDRVEFHLNGGGEVVVRKAPANRPPEKRRQKERVSVRRNVQMRRRAEELLALLQGLD